jgi:outer membrane protein assembly factor BamB
MRLALLGLLFCAVLEAQPILDSFSASGKQTTQTFSFQTTTSANANRASIIAVGERDEIVQSVTLGSQALTLLKACSDPQYISQATSLWSLPPGVQPITGTSTVTVTLSGTKFDGSTGPPRFAAAAAYNLSNADQITLVDQVACHQNPFGTYFQAESVSVTNTTAHAFGIAAITVPNTSDPADMATWPGTEDINTAGAGDGNLTFFSHVPDTGQAGVEPYAWTWTRGWEPDAAAVVTIKSAGTVPPPPPSTGLNILIGPASGIPATCPSAFKLTFYVIVTPGAANSLVMCSPGTSWLSASNKQWDTWPVPFHDPQHTGVSADVLTPPLKLLWTWRDNHQFDLNRFAATVSLPIGFDSRVAFQGGLNANRLICLNADRSPSWEADNSGYTESGAPFTFLNYPASVAGRVLFGSTDYTTTVSSVDGSGFMNIYNTNGGTPFGGLTGWNGQAYQQFIETDDGTENLDLYINPAVLDRNHDLHTPQTGVYQYGPWTPSVDPTTQTLYADVGASLRAIDANTFIQQWSMPGTAGSSPAVNRGIVYYSGSANLQAVKTGTPIWTKPIAGTGMPIVSNGVVYVGSTDGNFYALNAADGSTRWSFHVGTGFTSSQVPAISGQILYLPGANGNLYALNLATGVQVSVVTIPQFCGPGAFGGNISCYTPAFGPVIISGGLLYTSDSSGNFYAFSAQSAIKGS